jgi:outer membrane autotransporter protein
VVLNAPGIIYSNSGTIAGGAGGNGGNATTGFAVGKGADGGYGLDAVTSADTLINASGGSITGGNGGSTGAGALQRGGNGEAGVIGTGLTITNSGAITGGNGGRGGTGTGGPGITGSGLTITDSGSITGGLVGTTRANAITFTGGTNTLLLQSGFSLTGGISVTGSVAFTQSTAQTLSNVISGPGSVIQSGTGTLVLSGVNTYSGGTAINGGTLQIANDTNLGAMAGGLSFDGGTLATTASFTSARTTTLNSGGGTFDVAPTTTLTLSGAIGGAGALTKADTGTLVLIGASTYSGTTNVASGTLQAGSTTAFSPNSGFNVASVLDLNGFNNTIGSLSGIGIVTNNGTAPAILTAGNDNTNTTFSGTIQDGTSVLGLTKTGTGTLVLTGTNTYSGGTTIESGVLVAGVPIAGQATSFALGTGDVFLLGGTLRTPSLDPLIINVGRNYTQGPSGTLALGVAGVNGADYDHVQVQGNASLNGTLAVSSLNGFHPVAGNAFGVLTSGGVRTGQFATVDDFLNNNPNLQRVDVYSPNGVTLVYVAAVTPPPPAPTPIPTPIPPAPAPSPTPNPRSAVVVITPVPVPPVAPDAPIPPRFIFAALAPTAEQLTSMFEIGFSGANTQRFKLDERFDEIYRGVTGFSSNLPPAPVPVTTSTTGKGIVEKQPVLAPTPENRWDVWVNGWGDWVNVDNDGQAKGYNFTTGGFLMGVDYRITDHFAVGLMGGYAHGATNLQPSGDIDVNTGRGGLYATYFDHGFYINAAAYGGYNSYSTSRAALLGNANGSTDSGEFSTWTEAGYDFHFGDFTVRPLGALQYTLVHLDGFTEKGSLLPLQIHSNQEASIRTDLGAQATYTSHLGKVLVSPTLTVAWEHEYLYSALGITVGSAQFPGSATFSGPSEGHDGAIVNAGAAFQFTSRFSAYLGYQGQLGRDHYNSNAVTGGFSFSF